MLGKYYITLGNCYRTGSFRVAEDAKNSGTITYNLPENINSVFQIEFQVLSKQ